MLLNTNGDKYEGLFEHDQINGNPLIIRSRHLLLGERGQIRRLVPQRTQRRTRQVNESKRGYLPGTVGERQAQRHRRFPEDQRRQVIKYIIGSMASGSMIKSKGRGCSYGVMVTTSRGSGFIGYYGEI